MKILVVDDMLSMRGVMLHMLASLGYRDADEADNGLVALKMLRDKHYDLLITDLHMPNLDGKQLLTKIRQDEKLKHLPVLMASCEDDRKIVMSLIAEQVSGFMVKPFNIETLKKQLFLLAKAKQSLAS
ncbi:response regulator [Litorilituus sediminis]|uniref:Response regulator n=1 Tax=Litorilituus sediminis TaxID=718192 RepID=A0A4P6P2B2_9GAMM|nr:response regulator [Litorilituus sediminis]QBG35381.1 response regulator [Litorilituus sediminis]